MIVNGGLLTKFSFFETTLSFLCVLMLAKQKYNVYSVSHLFLKRFQLRRFCLYLILSHNLEDMDISKAIQLNLFICKNG